MREEIICPYCGGEMELRCVATCDWEPPMRYYKCLNCDSNSPLQIGGTLEDAAEKARKRYKPLQKPLTLKEAYESVEPCVYIEYKGYEIRAGIVCEHLVHFDTFDEVLLAIRCIEYECEDYLSPDDYGREIRCWASNPTEEEREAAKWEE